MHSYRAGLSALLSFFFSLYRTHWQTTSCRGRQTAWLCYIGIILLLLESPGVATCRPLHNAVMSIPHLRTTSSVHGAAVARNRFSIRANSCSIWASRKADSRHRRIGIGYYFRRSKGTTSARPPVTRVMRRCRASDHSIRHVPFCSM